MTLKKLWRINAVKFIIFGSQDKTMKKTNIKWLAVLCLLVQSTAFSAERYITIIRHGEAEHNIGHYYNSNPEHPNYQPAYLTALGKNQIAYTGLKLKIQGLNKRNIAIVIVSPLPRTQQTAKILADSGLFHAGKIKVDNRVIEVQAGSFEGKPYNPNNIDWDKPTVGAENRATLRCRMQGFYNEIIQQHPEGDIIVITHGSPSKQLIELLTHEVIKLKTADSITIPISSEPINVQKCSLS